MKTFAIVLAFAAIYFLITIASYWVILFISSLSCKHKGVSLKEDIKLRIPVEGHDIRELAIMWPITLTIGVPLMLLVILLDSSKGIIEILMPTKNKGE